MIRALVFVISLPALAQLRVEVRAANRPVPDALVMLDQTSTSTTDQRIATLNAPPSKHTVTISKSGFLSITTSLTIQSTDPRDVLIELRPLQTIEEEVTVSA